MQSLEHSRSRFGAAHWPPLEAARHLAVIALGSASAALATLATRLLRTPAALPQREPQVEFHAEAGAPEGALYVDGRLVGWIRGIQRL